MAPDRELEYPELLALWRTVPLSWRKLCRKDAACLALDLIQKYKPGIRLTAEGRPTKHVHKKRQYVAVGPALAAILDRPELAALKGGDELVAAKASQEYRQNRIAQDNLKNIVEARLGYQYETVKVSFWESDERVSFRIRSAIAVTPSVQSSRYFSRTSWTTSGKSSSAPMAASVRSKWDDLVRSDDHMVTRPDGTPPCPTVE